MNRSKRISFLSVSVLNEMGVFKPLLALGLVGGMVFFLINSSTSKKNFVPYQEFKNAQQISAKPDSKNESSDSIADSTGDSSDLSEINETLQDRIQPVLDSSSMASPGLPRETLELIKKGMELTEAGKFNTAEAEFEKAAQISPNSPEVHAIWATSLRMQEKYEGADRHFAKAFQLAPQDDEIAFNWGMSKLMAGDGQGAVELFEKSVALDPNNAAYYNYLGKAIGRNKDYPREEENYRKALSLQPTFAQAHFNLAVVLSLQNKIEDAVPHFKKAIALDPQFNKPFVQRFLQQYNAVNEIKTAQETQETSAEQTAKLDEATTQVVEEQQASKEKEKPMEGSKGMEGSSGKVEKEFTNVRGAVKINGEPIGKPAVVFMETKDKLRVPGQQINNVTISQSGLKFFPEHSVVRVNSSVTFVNEDREVHNIYSKSMNNQFNLGAMAAGTSKTITVTDAGPIILRCNMHKDMIGTIFVVPNGYFTQPDEKGEYVFDHVKSKEYLLQVWHPRLYPHELENSIKSIGLLGKDKVFDFDIKSESAPGEIHDFVDQTDYAGIVDTIEKLVYEAIDGWKSGKKYSPRNQMLMAITKHFDGEGLKGAIAKSFSEKRSANLESKLDEIRKKLSGLKGKEENITEASLKSEAAFVISQLRNNAQELKARLNPQSSQ